jgi:signal transduction histidine kinase/ActR/RegA family two-component response regulator
MMLGYTREELLRLSVREIDAQLSSEEIEARLHQILMDRFAIFSTRHRRKDGVLIDVEISASYLPIGEGRVITFIRDISERHRAEEERRRLEAQLQQAQKMEAVGQLTGGVAHDFNNLLQVINAGTDLALADLASDHPARPVLLEVTQAGGRAADLVRQLLVFSRRQIMRPEALDLNAVVEEVLRLIQRIIGEHIQLVWSPGTEVGTVCADRGMVEQTLMNLCVNGRDAMADGGVLSVSTQPVSIDADFCTEHPWAEQGSYVRLSVQDTGCGMDAQTMSHIFEPFYSTKEEGKGSGLGLSTVYGIVKQHRGLIHATSSPGSGALFEVYWPVSDGPVTVAAPATATECRGGIETILVAEDDEVVRGLSHRILTAGGYTVLVASDGEEAVRLFEAHQSEIDLVLLDAVMPRMGGREAYDRMRALRPGIPALFASGYSESAIHRNFVLEAGLELLQKPYTREPLLRAVRSVLDRKQDAGSG